MTTETTSATTQTTETTRERPRTTPTVTQGVTILEIQFGEDTMELSQEVVQHGQIRVEANNPSMTDHRVTVVRTDLAPGSLPLTDDNTVNERSMELLYDSPVGHGSSLSTTLGVTAGQYVFFCNEPNHYQNGEYAALIVE